MTIRVTHPSGAVIEFPDGTDEGTMSKAMAAFGSGDAPKPPPASPQRQAVDAWRKENPLKAGVFDVSRNIVRGLPFGSYVDELTAGVRSLRSGRPYADEKRMMDAMDQATSDNSTKLGTLPLIGDVTAGGLTSLAAGVATAPLAPVARVMQGATLLPRAVNLGVTGAGYGALYGAGEGNTTGERLGNLLLGGGLGGAIGAAAPMVGSGVSNAVGAIRDRSQALPRELQRFSRPAVNRMRELTQMDEIGQPELDVLRQRFGRPGMLADAGENMTTAAEALNQQPGPARRIISGAMDRRREGAQPRINADVDGALGPAVNLPATIEATRQHYAQAARPFYENFRNTAIPETPELRQMIETIRQSVPNAFSEARKRATGDRIPPQYLTNLIDDPMTAMTGVQRTQQGARVWSGPELDYLKRAVDKVANEGKRSGDSDAVRIFGNLARDFRNQVDELLSPGAPQQSPWAQGRAISEEGFDIRDAVEEGRNAFNKNLSADQLQANMQGMSQVERAATRLGSREALRSQMANAGTAFRASGDVKARQLLNSPEARRKVELLAENLQGAQRLNARIGAENRFADTFEQVMNNSATARRQAARDLIPRQYDAKSMGQLRQTSLSGFAMEGVGRLANILSAGYLNERNQMIARQMADMLVAQGVSRENIGRGLVEMANRANVSAQARQNINTFAEQVVRGSAPAAISSATPPEKGVLRGSQRGQGVR